MIFINHRINTIAQLKHIPAQNGIELDIRYHKNELVLAHNPFGHHEKSPEKFREFLVYWQNRNLMILNIKTEGIEEECITLMSEFKVNNWAFLDLSMPYFVLYAKKAASREIAGFSPENLMVRFSEYEPLEYALAFSGMAKWVWVDCFTHIPLDMENYHKLKNSGYRICLVSPELQKHPLAAINLFQKQIEKMPVDAICTKRPDLWGEVLPPETVRFLEREYQCKY
jgi:hypothetical protein